MLSNKDFIQEEHQIALMEIMQNYKIEDLNNEENLFIIFDEFYKKYGTFSIFTKSTNKLYLNAIKRVKEENEKRRKSYHYLLNINPPSLKLKELQNNVLNQTSILNNVQNNNNNNSNNNVDINDNNWTKFLQKVSKEKEMNNLANKNNILRKKEMEFLLNSQKIWENKKEQENIKYNNNNSNDKKNEEKHFKNFIENNLREISMNNNEFKRLLYLMKEKKHNENEKDSYSNNYNFNNCVSNLNNFYKSDETWERSTNIDGNNNNSKFRTSILINYNLNNLFQLSDETLKNNKRNFPIQYGDVYLNNYQESRVWKNFEYDFDKFLKEY